MIFDRIKQIFYRFTLECSILIALVLDCFFYPIKLFFRTLKKYSLFFQNTEEEDCFFDWAHQLTKKLKNIYRNVFEEPNVFEFSLIQLFMMIPNMFLFFISIIAFTMVYLKAFISTIFYPFKLLLPILNNLFESLYFILSFIPSIPEMVIEPESIGRMTPKSEDFQFSLSPLFNSKDKDSLPLMFAFSSSQKDVRNLIMRFKERELHCYHIDLIQSSSIHDLIRDYTAIVQSHLENHSADSNDIYFAGNGLCGEISIGVLQELLKRDDFRDRFTKIHVYFEEHSVPMPDKALSVGMWSLYPFLSACWTIDTVESLKQLQRDYLDVTITFEDTLKIKRNSPIQGRGLCSN